VQLDVVVVSVGAGVGCVVGCDAVDVRVGACVGSGVDAIDVCVGAGVGLAVGCCGPLSLAHSTAA
jgi:hypothetical protein